MFLFINFSTACFISIKNDKLGLDRDEELRSIIFIFDKHKNMCTNAHFQVHCFLTGVKLEAISKIGFWFKFKAGPIFNPQAY